MCGCANVWYMSVVMRVSDIRVLIGVPVNGCRRASMWCASVWCASVWCVSEWYESVNWCASEWMWVCEFLSDGLR